MSTQWLNPAGGDWTVGSNWSAGTPTASDDATLGVLSASYTVALTASGAANSLTLGGYTVTLTLSTPSGNPPASLAVQGDLSNAGSLYVDTSYGDGGSSLTVGGTLTNTDYLSIGNSGLAAATTATAAGLVNSGSFYLYGGSGTDTNRATLDITGASSASNAGFLQLASQATLRTQGDFSNTGTLYVDANYYVFGSDLAIGGTLTNTGNLYVGTNYTTSGGTTVSAAGLANTGYIALAGGTGTSTYQATLDIGNAAPSVLTGTFSLSGNALATFAGGGITGIAGGARLILNGGNALLAVAGNTGSNSALSGLANNAGTLELASGAVVQTLGGFNNNGSLYVDYTYYTAGSDLAIGGTLTNAGTLYIGANYTSAGSTTVSAAGLANTGYINLAGGSGTSTYQATLDITAGAAPSLLTGTLNLSGNALVEFVSGGITGIAAGSQLVLNGATAFVALTGNTGGNSALTGLASNAGTLDLESGAALQISGDFTNNGTLRVDYTYYTAGSDLAIGGTLNNAGNLYIGASYTTSGSTTVSAAGLANSGRIYLAGGTGTSTYQTTLDITAGAAPSVLTGTLSLTGNALVEFANGGIVDIAAGAQLILNGGNAFVADAAAPGSNSALNGLMSNAGFLELDNGAAIQTSGDFNNDGYLRVDYTYYTFGSDLAIGGTLNNAGSLYIGANYTGAGSTTVSATGLANTGNIYLAGGTGTSTYQATLDITAGATPSLLTGIVSLSGNALVEFASGGITGIAGGSQLILNGANAFIADAGAPGSNSALSGLASNAGTLELDSGAVVQTTGNFTNDGTLRVDYNYYTFGSDLAIGSTLNNAGYLYIGGGYTTSGSTTVSAAGLANTGAIYLYGGTGTSTYQATLDITGGAAPSVLTGNVTLSGHALVEFAGSSSISSIAQGSQLFLRGNSAFVADAAAPGSNSALDGLASNAGILELDSSAAIQTSGSFSNDGTLYIDGYYYGTGGATLSFGGVLTNTGNLVIGNNGLAAATTVSAAGLANAGNITLTGGIGTAGNQAVLEITGPATDSGTITIYGDAALNAGSLTVANGGSVTLTSGGTTSGVNIGAGGREIVASGGITITPTIAGGILELAGGTVAGGGIVFIAGDGTLRIDNNTMPTAPISGFAAGDAIDLRALSFDSTTTASYDSATSVLTVSGGGVTDMLTLSGIAPSAGFAVANDGVGGTLVTLMPAAAGAQWTNSAGGDWNVAGNWAGGVPTSTTDAVIGTPGGYTVLLTAGGAANSLLIDHAGANLSIVTSGRTGGSLAIQGDLTNRGGVYVDTGAGVGGSTLLVGGALTTSNYLQIGNGNLSAATTVSATSLSNAGTLYLLGGSIAGSTLDVAADFSNGVNVYIDNGSGQGNSRLNVGGTLTNTNYLYIGNSSLSAATIVTAAGLANTGTIYLTGGVGTNTNQATLDITAGTAPTVLTGTLTLSGRALLEFAGGSIATIAYASRLTLNGSDAFIADAAAPTSNSALSGLASNNGYLELNSGAAIQTAGDSSNNGTLYVDYLYYNTSGGSSLSVGGTLTNTGTLYIGPYANQPISGSSTVSAAGLANTGNIALTGGTGTSTYQAMLDISAVAAPSVLTGTFNLSGHALLEFASGSIASIANNSRLTLSGVDAFVADASNITANSALGGLSSNAGYLELNSGAAIQTAGDFNNNSTLYVDYLYYNTSGGSSLAVGGTLTNVGTLYIGPYANQPISGSSTVSAAGLANTGNIALTGGSGTSTYQATLDISAAAAPSVLAGTFNLSGHALLKFAGGSIGSIGSGARLTLGGVDAFVANTTNLAANSALGGLTGNSGYLELNSGAAIQTAGIFNNNGTLYVDYLYYNTSGGGSLAVGGTLTNAGTLYIGPYANHPASGSSTVSAAGLVNTGNIALTGGIGTSTYQATLDISGPAPTALTGTFNLSGNALLEFASGGSITGIAAGGSLTLKGTSAFVADAADTTNNSALGGLASNAGYLELDGGAAIQTAGGFSNNGTLYVDYLYYNTSGGSSLAVGGTLTNAGSLYIGQYANQVGPGSTVTVAALDNSGTIYLFGGTGTSTTQATLDITAGTAPAVLTGTFDLSGHALLEFGSGGINSIGYGASLSLTGPDAFVADASINTTTNSALGGLASNAGNLNLRSGASIQITGDFGNSGYVQLYDYYANAVSNLTIGGTLNNTGNLYLNNQSTSGTTTITAAGLDNGGTINLYANVGTSTYQTVLDIAGAAVNRNSIYVYGNSVISATSLTLVNGGTLSLQSGGTATGVIVGAGGHEYVYSGGVSTDAMIAGGILELAGGAVTAATIDFAPTGSGELRIDGTTMPSNAIAGFHAGNVIDLRGVTFGSAATGVIGAANVLSITAGGNTYALQLDTLHYYTGASVILTSDGAGGTDVAVTGPPIFVSSGQTLTISSGTTYDNVNVLNGGTLIVLPGGTATETIDSGSELLSGTDLNGVVGGGILTVAAGGLASATTVSATGQMTVTSGGFAVDATIAGGWLDLDVGAVVSGSIAFAGTGSTLEIDDATMPTNTITGFSSGDMIDLRALAWSPTNSASFNPVTNSLTVTGGGTTDILTLTGVPAGTRFAVTSDGLGGTLVGQFQNNGTLTGSYLDGVVLSNPTTQNPTTLATGGYIANQTAAYNGDAVYGTNAAAWAFRNFGTINGTAGAGVDLAAGGTVTNAAATASIAGYIKGILIQGSPGTVDNLGTIIGTGTNGIGVYLAAGGNVSNGTSGAGALISGGFAGVKLASGGSVSNGASGAATATITGAKYGVWAETGAATLGNFGTVAATGSYGDAVFLYSGGTVTNAVGALITGVSDGVCIMGGPGTVINSGSIAGAVAIELQAGGNVSNAANGSVAGGGDAVRINGTAAAVLNLGNIAGTTGRGVILSAGGSVTNGATGTVNALITAGGNAVDFGYGTGSLVNFGTLASTGGGFGVYGGSAGGVTNYGQIVGSQGVNFASGGSVTNGSVALTSASISGYDEGVRIERAAGAVTNFGSVTAGGSSGDGALLLAGGSVTNALTGVIAGPATGVSVAGASGTIVNSGLISASGGAYPTGVYLAAGGTVVNSGTISAATGTIGTAIDLAAGGTIVNNAGGVLYGADRAIGIGGTAGSGSIANAGTISGGVDAIDLGVAAVVGNSGTIVAAGRFGIFLTAGGSVTNASSGLIAGYTGVLANYVAATVANDGTIIGNGSSGAGVDLAFGGGTLINGGTITGVSGYAVRFGGGNNRLIIEPGAVFVGAAYGGNGNNDVLELAAGTGSIDGSPGQYSGFENLTVDLLADWQLTGLASLAAGGTLSNSGTLTVADSLAVGGDLVDTGIIRVGAAATLALANGASGTGSIAFAGAGGTLEIDGTTMPAATITISGFTPGETIDLRGVGGGNAGSVTLDAGNLLTVFEGGSSYALQLDPAQSFGGFGLVADGFGGTDILSLAPVVVSAGVPFVVSAGQTLIGVLVESGGVLEVGPGAQVFGTQISAGGTEIIDSGGFDSGTLVFSGGLQIVSLGGTALDTTLEGAATQTVFGSAGGTTVSGSLTQIVGSGGVASGTIILSGGLETVQAGGLTIDTVIAGGTLDLDAGALASGTIDFSSIGGVLEIDSNTMPTATIVGFTVGDSIDLRALSFDPTNSATYNFTTGVLTVSSTSTTDTLTMSGVTAGTTFAVASDGAGGTLVQQIARSPSLFDFVFTYNDGQDYYYGTVCDDGTYGYRVGQTITALPGIALAGQYEIFAQEGLPTSRAVGTVLVINYSHGGPGVASPTPLGFSTPGTAGSNGLGSESDAVLGTDGQLHSFGPTTGGELSFPTADLYGFVFTYADGAAFYSGSVAVTTGTTPVIPAVAGMLGSYSVFAQGVTTRAANTVVVDRFTVGDVSFTPDRNGAIDGTGGLGSETDSITVNGTTQSFSDTQEPVLTLIVPTVPPTPLPGTSTVIIAEVNQVFSDVLGRSPTATELQTYSAALSGGTSLASIRTTLAQSAEAQDDLNGLYLQIFNRPATTGELSTNTGELAAGSSLRTVQLMLAQSSEAMSDIATIYSEVLGRGAAGSELTAYMVQLGNEPAAEPADSSGRSGIIGVRDIIAHSSEAQTDLMQLFQGIIGRAPGADELVGLEDQLSKPGFSLATLGTALTNDGAAAAGTTIVAGAGSTTLNVAAGTPTLFDFTNLAFGNDTIVGFDPFLDTIELPDALVANLATLLQEGVSAAGGGTLIAVNPSQSILLSGIAPTSIGQTNFLLV
ncbi:MAG TPA: hypothetical protein VGQ90_09740 [Stellaceae bacterium]|nr:hypothetical protein [Stellaceae bacterium]